MALPNSVAERIAEAHEALFRHPARTLLPWYRYAIYSALAAEEPQSSRLIHAWLDILAVRHILFCWQPPAGAWLPSWPQPQQLLALAEELLANPTDATNVRVQLNRAQALADIVGAAPTAPDYPSWCVYEAALRSLNSAWLAAQPQRDHAAGPIDCANDASGYAAIAVAGASWQSPAAGVEQAEDAQLRRAVFWEWWLRTGVPTAWRMVSPQPMSIKLI